MPTRTDYLDRADEILNQSRYDDYGEPEDNFQVIAEMMTAYLSRRFGIRIPLQAADVANLMLALKLGRLAANPQHEDSYVDAIGYAAAGGEAASNAEGVTSLQDVDLIRKALKVFGDLNHEWHAITGETNE